MKLPSPSFIPDRPLQLHSSPPPARGNRRFEMIGPKRTPPLLPLLLLLLLSSFHGSWRCQAQQRLAQEEVSALKVIAAKMKKTWDFTVDPCSGSKGWADPTSNSDVANTVVCECNSTSGSCHVTGIILKAQNLTGSLPAEFANLTKLTVIDLTRNYLNGSIPAAWATLPLVNLTLLGNRISGRIPLELGNITTLQSIVLENNLLQYSIPESIGGLLNLNRFFVSANNLSGELPKSLGNLKNMNDFRIDGNPITGKIPSFIGNWTQLSRLDIQGTNLEGPFPPSLSNLTSITDLKLTDISGMGGEFPPLQNMKNMKRLVLRGLSINGQLPDFIGDMTGLKLLDLSFNNISGSIPDEYESLKSLDFMFLTNNMLSGTIPHWILNSNLQKVRDLSYNNFNGSDAPSFCQMGSVNLVSSYSSTNSSSIQACLQKDFPCLGMKTNYNFSINCGGKMVTIGDLIYEEDMTPQGQSYFSISDSKKWAYSSTGVFVGNDDKNFIAVSASKLNITDSELYTTARLTPLSLKYYGVCLQKGNYTVSLHFAEIMFIDDQTYFSVGKRLFDVSIQGKKVLRDFDIVKEANGTGRKIVKNITAVVDGTLEIHFQWMGKGTNSIPTRGVYGPLVSAISVTPNFKPVIDFTPDTGGKKLSTGAIIGIVAAVCLGILLILVLSLWFCYRRKPQSDELRGIELQTGFFTLRQIKAATNNFNPANKIGEGGFGPVYKGELPDGSLIAVKQLSSKSRQGNKEFVNEIGMISALNHPNLVKLFGCCIEGNQLLLVYEYMENNSLARLLFGQEKYQMKLDWQRRRKICIDIARGLAYLHEESRLKIVHRDIKATNILLDKDLNAKISDFGLAKLHEEENTHISTRIAGTVGYMAPEYAMRGYLTDKADVYSFGVVILEIVSGRSNTSYKPKEDFVYLLDWAYVLQEQGNLLELVDPDLGINYLQNEALQMLQLCLLCTNPSPTLRPKMSAVLSMLDGTTQVKLPSFKHAELKREDIRFRSFETWSHDSKNVSTSVDMPWSGSTAFDPSKTESSDSSTTNILLEQSSLLTTKETY